MKKIKLLIPLAATVAATIPAFTVTSCQHDPVDAKLITTGNSIITRSYQLPTTLAGKQIKVIVETPDSTQEKVKLWDMTTGQSYDKIDCTVPADGKIELYVGLDNAPSVSSVSTFNLKYNDQSSNNNDEVVLESDLKFNYVVDYGADLLSQYPAQTPAEASHWTQSFDQQYTADIIANSNIFQNDARYTTSKNILSAWQKTKITGLTGFKAYFNDIAKVLPSDTGVHVHMNYEVNGDSTSLLTLNQTSKIWKFTKFNFNFSLETKNAYQIEKQTDRGSSDEVIYQIIDKSAGAQTYLLDGRFKGTFTYQIGDTSQGTPSWGQLHEVNFNNIINNHDVFVGQDEEAQAASMLAFGIISLTYGYDFDTEADPVLKIISPFGKNVPA